MPRIDMHIALPVDAAAVAKPKDGKEKDAKVASSAIFLTEVMLILGDLTFQPAASDFENELESIVSGFVDTISGTNRLLNHEELEQYTELYDAESEANEASTVADIITNDEEYQRLVSNLKDAIENAFVSCHDYLKEFEPFRDMVIENEKLDAEQLRDGAEVACALSYFAARFQALICCMPLLGRRRRPGRLQGQARDVWQPGQRAIWLCACDAVTSADIAHRGTRWRM